MTAPVVKVELGFGSTWQTAPASITWTDVTAYVLQTDGISMQRGASSARGQVDVGSMGLSFKNADRRFDPTYAAGPYYADLKPGVPVRVTATPAGGVSAATWYGSIAKWPQRYDLGNKLGWVPVEAYDGFDKLARAKIPRYVLEKEILADSPIGYWKLDETAGQVMVDASGNGNHGTYTNGTTALSTQAESTSGASLRGLRLDGEHAGQTDNHGGPVTDRPGVLEAIIAPTAGNSTGGRTLILGGSGNPTAQSFLGAAAPTSTTWTIFGVLYDGDADNVAFSVAQTTSDAFHHVAFRRPAATAALTYIDGADVTDSNSTATTALSYPPGVTLGHSKMAGPNIATTGYFGFVAHVAHYDSDIGAARIAAHSDAALAPLDNQTTDERITFVLDEIGWPALLRDLEVGQTTLGPATFKPGDGALDYLRMVERTEDGRMFCGKDGKLRFLDRYWRYLNTLATTSQVTFSDQSTGRGYAEFDLDLDDELLINTARFTRRDGVEQVATDATSVATYGEAEKQQGDLLLRTDVEVKSLAQWTVATNKTPLPRVPKIRVPLHNYSAADQATVLGLELGYRVTVNRTPQEVGTAISTDFLIDGISHEVGNGEWWWTAFVQPVPAATAPVFVLGTSTLGGTHILGY